MNCKDYLLGLLDGSHTLSNEGIGLVLERLAVLERMANVGKDLVESSITQADILEDGSIVPTRCAVNPEVFDQFQDALAALEECK